MSGEVIVDIYEPNQIKVALGDLATIASLKDTPGGADYFWMMPDGKTIAIERKEASDYVSSLYSERLGSQLARLVEHYDFPILLTEGNFNSNHDGLVVIPGKNGHLINKHIPFTALMSTIFELQTGGAYHIHTNNLQTTCRFIKGLYEWSQKEEHNLLSSRRRVNIITGRADDPVWLVMGLPGIGVTLARPLLEMFGSPYAVFMAFANPAMHPMIKQIRGINDKKIDQVREVLLPDVNYNGSVARPARLGAV